jgi:Leucine-rich repeat (LRR) protein
LGEATLEAWLRRGFDGGWMRERGGTVWLNSAYPKGYYDAIPALWPRRRDRELSNEDLKELPQVAVPFALNLSGRSTITDAGLKHLASLKNLSRLDLTSSRVTGEGLKHLAGLDNLSSLKLSLTQVTDENLKHLSECKGLRVLYLGRTRVTDAGLRQLAGLTNLTALNLSSTGVSDAGLKHLAGLDKLSEIYLDNTRITDVGLEELARHSNLTVLIVSNSGVTGESLKPLGKLKRLTHFGLESDKITDQVLESMQQMGLLHALAQVEVYGGTESSVVDGRRPTKADEARSFNLNRTRATGHGVQYLTGLPQLTNLYLGAGQVTPEGLKHAASLPRLTVLHLGSAEVSSDKLRPLAGHKNLTHLSLPITDETLIALYEAKILHQLDRAAAAKGKRPATPDDIVSLDLSGTGIKGDCLKYIARLHNLTTLNLRDTSVRDAWVMDFQRTLKKCKVLR